MLTVARLHLEQICLRSYVRNKFGYNVVTTRIKTPDLYCSASRKQTPGHKRPHAQTDC